MRGGSTHAANTFSSLHRMFSAPETALLVQVFFGGFAVFTSLLTTGDSSTDDRNRKLVTGMLSLMFYIVLTMQMQPYKMKSDDTLWNVCLVALWLNLYMGQQQVGAIAVYYYRVVDIRSSDAALQ